TRGRVAAGSLGQDIRRATDGAQAERPIATAMDTNKRRFGMPPGQVGQILRRRFTRAVSQDIQPGVLNDRRLQLAGPGGNRIGLRDRAAPRHPEFDAYHWTVFDAAVQLLHTEFGIVAAEIHKTEGAVRITADRLQRLVVLP